MVVDSVKASADEHETVNDGQNGALLEQSGDADDVDDVDDDGDEGEQSNLARPSANKAKMLTMKKVKTSGRVMSYRNMRLTSVNDAAYSYSHRPTLDRQETSKKVSDDEEE